MSRFHAWQGTSVPPFPLRDGRWLSDAHCFQCGIVTAECHFLWGDGRLECVYCGCTWTEDDAPASFDWECVPR